MGSWVMLQLMDCAQSYEHEPALSMTIFDVPTEHFDQSWHANCGAGPLVL